MEIKIHYHHDNPNWKLNKISKGDWIDLYVCGIKLNDETNWRAEDAVHYKAGDVVVVNFGFALMLPENYEAHIAPRSSTFQNWGLLQTNSVGVCDYEYAGPNDLYMCKFFATRDGVLEVGQRTNQFRVFEHQPPIEFMSVSADEMKSNRGGFGSTGK